MKTRRKFRLGVADMLGTALLGVVGIPLKLLASKQ